MKNFNDRKGCKVQKSSTLLENNTIFLEIHWLRSHHQGNNRPFPTRNSDLIAK